MRIRSSISFALLLGLPLSTIGGTLAQDALTIPDLKKPRGLSVAGDVLLIAEQSGGRILSVAADGTTSTVLDKVTSGEFVSPEGPTAVGVDAVVMSGDTYFFTIGGSLGSVAGSEGVYTMKAGEAPKLLADLGKYEEEHNTGDDVNQQGAPDIDSNPYDLVADGEGGVFVTDSGANAVLHVNGAGEIKLFAFLPDRDNPLAPNVGGPKIDQVPTGITMGPDDALYVTTLTGFPFPSGAARVYRMADSDDDGDATDDGEVTVFAEGLTTATDLAFDADGALLVTEFSTDMLKQAPGRLVRVKDDQVSEVAGGLVSPTAVAVLGDGRIMVTQEFPGVVMEVKPAK